MALNTWNMLSRRASPLVQALRTLYSAEALGIPKYKEEREKTKAQYSGEVTLNRFKARIAECAKPDAKGSVFSDDLKTFLHVASETEEDAEAVLQLLKRYRTQNVKGDFVFGPVIMRYFYLTDKPVQALKAFCDPALEGMFDYTSCIRILMGLLYKHNMYDELFAVYDVIKAKKNIRDFDLFVSSSYVILGACYKKNTPESYTVAQDLLKSNEKFLLKEQEAVRSSRRIALVAALALKQNDPSTAMELISRVDERGGILPRNIKIMALSALDRPEDALSTVKKTLLRGFNVRFVPEAIQSLKESINRISDGAVKEVLSTELEKTEVQLKEKELLAQHNLDHYLLLPPRIRQRTDEKQGGQRRKQKKAEESDSDSD